jgi:hypothetical protein
MKHPNEMAEPEVESFLSDLAVNCHVASSTQKTALCALVFLYGTFMNQPLVEMQVTRSKRKERVQS